MAEPLALNMKLPGSSPLELSLETLNKTKKPKPNTLKVRPGILRSISDHTVSLADFWVFQASDKQKGCPKITLRLLFFPYH